MPSPTAQQTRADAVRDRAARAAAGLLADGRALTFRELAAASGIPERTLYRCFPNREALLAAVFAWTNARIGFTGELPQDEAAAVDLVRRAFPAFDEVAPVVEELLRAPEGRAARQAGSTERQRAALQLVKTEVPGLDRAATRRVAAAVQLLTTAGAWHALRDHWDLDGEEAAETAALAIELVLAGARARADGTST